MGEIKEVFSYEYEDKFDIEDTENRRLFINSEISNFTCEPIRYQILRYNRLDKGIPVEERKPIIVYINSLGGSVIDGYSVIDTIVASKTPVYTVNLGYCYSMGFLIFLAGHKRYSLPSATFLMHDGSSFAYDSSAKLKDRIDFESNQVEKYTKEYIMSKTVISEDTYDKKYREEWYMYPPEAKKYGICDYIIGTDADIDDIV